VGLASELTSVRAKLRSYDRVYGWVIGDVCRASPVGVAGVAASSFVGVAARFGAIGVVMAYVHALSEGRPATLCVLDLPTPDEPESMPMECSTALILAIATAVLTHAAE